MKVTCCQCGHVDNYELEDVKIDSNGYGYDTKLVECPVCGQLNILKKHYKTWDGFDVNGDERWYK